MNLHQVTLQVLQVTNHPVQATATPARPSLARRRLLRAQTVQTLTLLGDQHTATQLIATATPAQAAPRAPLSHPVQPALPATRLRRAATRPPASQQLTMTSTRLKTCQKKLSTTTAIIKESANKNSSRSFMILNYFFTLFQLLFILRET